MSRAIAVLLGTLALTACSEATNKPAQDPSSTTSVTSAPSKAHHQAKPGDPAEEREDNGDSLRN
jgi:hypothetical protein